MSPKQLEEINTLLLAYSSGNYEQKGMLSDQLDEIDLIISGINMLGEELMSTNVSKDYFSSIYNAVTDLVFILDNEGVITDLNLAVSDSLQYTHDELYMHKHDLLLPKGDRTIFEKIKTQLSNNIKSYATEARLVKKDGEELLGLFTCSKIINRFGEFKGYLMSVKDITQQKETEKLILKTIVTTQQTEQKRMADDLHDSLGQELSMAKLMLTNLEKFEVNNKEYMPLLNMSKEILDAAITHLREVCFDLMPSVLVKGGLDLAIQELLKKFEKQDKFHFHYNCSPEFPRFDPDIEVVAYRIIQEFINNLTKHSNADNVWIDLDETKKGIIRIKMNENGQGFDPAKLDKRSDGRGISNLQSKVTAFNGSYELKSAIGEGTSLTVEFPKTNNNGES